MTQGYRKCFGNTDYRFNIIEAVRFGDRLAALILETSGAGSEI